MILQLKFIILKSYNYLENECKNIIKSLLKPMKKTVEKDIELINQDELISIRKEKLRKEIDAAKKILSQNIEPLEIADKFIHNTFKLMIDGIKNMYPELNEKKINQKMIEALNFKEKLKSKRNRNLSDV